MKSWTFAGAALAAASACLAPLEAQARDRVEFHVSAGALDRALLAFADQAHISLALPDQDMSGTSSNGVSGRLDVEHALARLLAGSGFSYRRAGDRAYRIVAAAQPEQNAATQSETIIVTAARAPRMLRNLPRSIADIDGRRLEQTQSNDLVSLSRDLSGVEFTNVGDGRNKPYLRGLSDGAATGRAQSTVGLYLDGVRLTYAAADPDLQLVDVKRIDVLRGPQGALYGAGSIGGVVSIESNAPDSSAFYGSALGGVEAVHDGDLGYNSELVVNAPLIENRLALRYAGYAQSQGGWLDNSATGEQNTNDVKRRGSRLSAQLEISPHWRARAFGLVQAIDSGDSQYLTFGQSGAERSARIAEPHDNDFRMAGFSLHGETSLGDIESTSAEVRHETNSRYDASGSFASFGVDPNQARPMDENSELAIFVHETRLSAPSGARLPWFAGVFFADGDTTSRRTLRDGTPGIWQNTAYREDRRDAINEFAVFGETTWRLNSALSLSTGARYFEFNVKTGANTEEPLLALAGHTQDTLSDSGFAPDIRLSYQPRTNWLFYLGASEGYRSAGFNTGEPIGIGFSASSQPFRRFTSDELWTYEAGSRLYLFDDRLEVSTAAFVNEWKNAQTDQLVSGSLSYTGNIGDVRAVGYEGDIRWSLSDALTLRGHVLVNEPDIVRRDPAFPVGVYHLPGAPEFQASASLSYEVPLDAVASGARGALEFSLAHVGASPANFESGEELDGYTSADASARLSTPNYDVDLFIDNIFDAHGETLTSGNPYVSPNQTAISDIRPRTLGFSVRRRF